MDVKVSDFLREWQEKYPDLSIAPPPEEIMREKGLDYEDEEERKKVLERVKKLGYQPSSPISAEEKREHSEKLKSLIRDWKEKLNESTTAKKLVKEIEEKPLFPDLKVHLRKSLFKKWKEFKELHKKYHNTRQDLLSKIKGEVERIEKSGIPINGYFSGDVPLFLLDSSLEKLESGDGFDLISKIRNTDILGVPESKLVDISESEPEEISEYEPKEMSVSELAEMIESKPKGDWMLRVTVSLMEEIIQSIYQSEKLEELDTSYNELNRLKGEIEGRLERYLNLTTFSGCCEYLVGEPSYLGEEC
ncbi:hypothetical protein AKJ65_07875 [candidate division MSBL1 archaeon SCGC-AAA259E19]|uniref:Uncharacterized protein n=1 Tax=candidate division MSBL1 archaeon SCGC-AAA259E19 TaxID=1698264 RepID=A0A133UDQ5_9EURY|nr:hypothetical protein AKJ65_07875 [candidate division MSBL1 archaeon SCGC-AAA259E19]